jgi:hypothetical protein
MFVLFGGKEEIRSNRRAGIAGGTHEDKVGHDTGRKSNNKGTKETTHADVLNDLLRDKDTAVPAVS